MVTVRQVVLVILVVVCLAAAAWVSPGIDLVRDQLGMQSPVGPESNRPEIVLLTNLLGGFRGLLVDAVWLRAVKLQQSGKFWELYQLYDWMGKLEPHLQEIWDFNGWNMAYNLVAELPDSEARWQWIQRAIEWLRDQGLKYNPRSGKIMERISWIYFHKIGRDTDLHHFYYKHRLALEMYPIFLSREAQDTPGLAAAPKELADLLKEPDVAAVLSTRFKLDPPDDAVRKIDEAHDLLRTFPQEVGEALAAAKNEAAVRKIRNYVTARVLRTRYKMDRFDIMKEMEEKYGKFEWRLPEPYSIYWSRVAAATDPIRKRQIEYDRLLMYCLQETMRRGQIAYMGPNPNEPLITAFDLSKVEPLDKLYEEMLQKHSVAREDYGAESVRDGHIQFLQEVTFDLYFAGYRQEAQKYHLRLKNLYNKPDPYLELDEDMLGRVKKLVDEYGTTAKVRAFVDGLIFQTCFYLCTNKMDQAREFENLAQRAWDAYCEYTEAQAQGRVRAPRAGLPTFKEVERDNVRNILMGRTPFPKALVPILRRVVGVPDGAELEKVQVEKLIVPSVPPSSPPPK